MRMKKDKKKSRKLDKIAFAAGVVVGIEAVMIGSLLYLKLTHR